MSEPPSKKTKPLRPTPKPPAEPPQWPKEPESPPQQWQQEPEKQEADEWQPEPSNSGSSPQGMQPLSDWWCKTLSTRYGVDDAAIMALKLLSDVDPLKANDIVWQLLQKESKLNSPSAFVSSCVINARSAMTSNRGSDSNWASKKSNYGSGGSSWKSGSWGTKGKMSW